MPEPTTTTSGLSLAALFIAVLGPALGPVIGPKALIVVCALAGALWPLSTMELPSKAAGGWFLVRIVLTAVVLTGSAAWWLESRYQFPAAYGMAVVAFFIGALGNGWRPVLEALGGMITRLLGAFKGGSGGGAAGGQP